MITDKVGGSSAKPEVSKQSKEKRLKHKVSGYKSQSKRRLIAGCRLLLRTLSSVGRAPDCRAGGRGFDSLGRTITQLGLKITEKWRYSICTASIWIFAWLRWPRKMVVMSPVRDVKIVSPISTLTQMKRPFFFKESKKRYVEEWWKEHAWLPAAVWEMSLHFSVRREQDKIRAKS